MKQLLTTIIILTTTTIQVFGQVVKMPDYENQHKSAVKVEIFSPLTGNLTLGYERFLQDWITLEGRIGLIGIGTNYEDQRGAFIKIGPKFKFQPAYAMEGMRSQYLLGGGYIRTELIVSVFEANREKNVVGGNNTHYSVAAMLNIGKQLILGKMVVLDWNIGIGYGIASQSGWYYSHANGPKEFPLAASAGLALGILLP